MAAPSHSISTQAVNLPFKTCMCSIKGPILTKKQRESHYVFNAKEENK